MGLTPILTPAADPPTSGEWYDFWTAPNTNLSTATNLCTATQQFNFGIKTQNLVHLCVQYTKPFDYWAL